MDISSAPSTTGSFPLDDRNEPVYLARDGHTAAIVLNRPEKLNAITRHMWMCLHEAITILSADTSLRCIVLRSTSPTAFSPGCDIHEFSTCRASKRQAREYGELMHRTLEAFVHCPVPVIAEIRGLCIGAGLELASVCDIRLCGESARFGAPVKNLGLVMAYPELKPLLMLTSPDVLMEILLEGRIFNAREALDRHLVTRVIPDEQLAEAVRQSVSDIATGAPLAARWHKRFIRRLADPSPVTPQEYDECFDCFDTMDYEKGYRAFVNRSHPDFDGK